MDKKSKGNTLSDHAEALKNRADSALEQAINWKAHNEACSKYWNEIWKEVYQKHWDNCTKKTCTTCMRKDGKVPPIFKK